MQELYRSDLLRSLGWAITDSLWQMSLLWLVYQLMVAIPFRKKPSVKHLGAFATLLAGTVWFLFTFFNRFAKERVSTEAIGDTPALISISLTNILNSTLPYFSTAYLLILVLLFARLSYNFISTQRLKTDLKPAIDWQHVVNRLTVSLGISREVFIYISEHITVPSTIGYLKPIILLPLATVNQLSVEQLEAVIIHEMAHIRRNDYLVNLVVAIIETILFFNPFAHLLGRAIRKECELCCDDEVICQQDPQSYAQALLLLERSKVKPAMAMAVTGKQGMLLGRVKRILNVPDQEVKYRHKLLALVLLAGLIMLTAVLAPSKISEQDRLKTKVVASQVMIGEAAPAPLPFIMKIAPEPAAPAKQKAIHKERKIVTRTSLIQKKDERVEKVEFVSFEEKPVMPEHPVAPPSPALPPDELIRYFNVPTPQAVQEEMTFTFKGPDPRDRRSADILGKPKVKTYQRKSINTDDQRTLVEGFRLAEFEKMEESIRKAGQHADVMGMAQEIELHENMRKAFATSPVKVKKIQQDKKPLAPGADFRKSVRTIPSENGMTITIIHNDEQIEITVKDMR
ncbi:MAG TPA: M56 family metallopeptidase [Chitinophagaceae bacterium]|nr:M56 family metallopeptidase [Chitinophagaceae bacterium]